MIDGVDGRVHHIEMDATRAEDVGRGMIVAAGSAPPGPRAADRNILDIAGQGGVDGRVRTSKDFIANLERTEVTRVGKTMAAQRGLTFTTAKTGEYVSGTLLGSTQLASGRFAMIDDGIGFQLVPWQPVLDKRIGQHITGIMRDAGGIEWGFGRKRGLGI